MSESHQPVPNSVSDRDGAALRALGDALRGLRFGTVTAIVQDGVVVQVERTEKQRLGKRPHVD